MRYKFAALALLSGLSWSLTSVHAQQSTEPVDREIVEKIKQEGSENSQVMETISYLTDVYGPRLTGSPYAKKAAAWTVGRLGEWGLVNAQLEPWGPFGRGWTLEKSSFHLVEPTYSPLIAHVKAWSPSTIQSVRGVPIYMDVQSEEDLEKYRGKLGRAIVLISPPRDVEALFEPPAVRKTDEELLRLANAEPPSVRGSRGSSRGRRPSSSTASSSTNSTPATEQAPSRPDPRTERQLLADKWQMAYTEGAAVILEPGRGDGGNVFVSAVTMPRITDDPNAPNNPLSRGPRPWATEETTILPQAVMAVEHYNRLVRMLQKGVEPVVEVDIVSSYNNDDPMTFNIIAEIPGTDLADEIVMLGAHFDSWQAGTGATDNAAGCGVALEAVRILQAIGVKPRRTIRIALWTGEEQGLLGSRAYVAEHFGKRVEEPEGDSESRQPRYRFTAEHEKVSAYFNLDNGTGKIRGIYLQGNEAVRPIFRSWLSPFSDMDASTITISNTGGTDHQSFDGIGIPGFQFIQDEVEYDTRTHHSSMDVYERIQAEDMKQASMIMATFVYHTAMRDERLPRKPFNGEVVKDEPTTAPAPAEEVPAAEAAVEAVEAAAAAVSTGQ